MDHNYWGLIERTFCENRTYELEEIQKGLIEIFGNKPELDDVEDVFDHLIDKRSNGNTKK